MKNLTMKKIIQFFREALLKELRADLEEYDHDGKMTLYHFAPSAAATLRLDPNRFLTHGSTYSRNERNASEVPRIFFYTSSRPRDVERDIMRGKMLYFVEVPISEIYDLKRDPEGIVAQATYSQYGAHTVVWTKVFELIKEKKYKGAFYERGFDIVIWFEPIVVRRVEQ